MRSAKLLLAVAGATVLLGALVGVANAGRFSTTSQTLRAAFSSVTFSGAFGNIRCVITLEGSLHRRTADKTPRRLVGFITRATLGTCETGAATLLAETLPWHAQFDGFTGTLPNITSVRAAVVGAKFSVREPLFTCLATTTAEGPAIVTFNRDVATRVYTTSGISGTSIETTCGRVGSLSSASGTISVLGAATRVTLTLI